MHFQSTETTDLSIRRASACLQAAIGETKDAAIILNQFLGGGTVDVTSHIAKKAIAIAEQRRNEAGSATALQQFNSAIQLLVKMRDAARS